MRDLFDNNLDEKNADWRAEPAGIDQSPQDNEKSGGLEKVMDLASTGALVFLKKRDGTWGKGTVNTLLDDGNSVAVIPEGSSMTILKTTDFLKWQEEGLVDDSAWSVNRDIQLSESERLQQVQEAGIRERVVAASGKVKKFVEKSLGDIPFGSELRDSLRRVLANRNDELGFGVVKGWTDDEIKELYSVLYGEDMDQVELRNVQAREAKKIEDLKIAEQTIGDIIDRTHQFPLGGELRQRVDIWIEMIKRNGNISRLEDRSIKNSFYEVAHNDKWRNDLYPGWSVADIGDLYRVLYNEEMD